MKLKLYISDPRDDDAKEMALQVCRLIESAQLEIININERPEEAHADVVVTAPTLLWEGPPKRRVVGPVHNARAAATYLTLPEW